MIQKIYEKDTVLLEGFNQLTRKTFGFDFVKWHAAGHFSEMYLPHVIVADEKVVSNVSVNQMQFDMGGVVKNYLQIGTVMTDKEYQGKGLNREIMEAILQEYQGKVDGIYLFGNDSVLEYYPKFGFVPSKEYEYYMSFEQAGNVNPYVLEKVDMKDEAQAENVYAVLHSYDDNKELVNENDAMYMSKNINLYHFWLDATYKNNVYHVKEENAYVVAEVQDNKLFIYQVIGKQNVEINRVAAAFEGEFSEVVLGFTPVHKDNFNVREHKEEDCTFFILGEDLKCVEEGKMMFPVLSHA